MNEAREKKDSRKHREGDSPRVPGPSDSARKGQYPTPKSDRDSNRPMTDEEDVDFEKDREANEGGPRRPTRD